MAIHMVAYSAALSTTVTRRAPVSDTVIRSSSTAFVLERPMHAVAAYAGAAGITSARISLPRSLLSPAYIRPIDVAANPVTDPNVYRIDPPLTIEPATDLAMEAAGSSGTLFGIVLLRDRFEPVPAGEAARVYFVQTSAQTPTAGAWTSLTNVLWSTGGIAGRWAITGMEIFRTDIIAARLILQRQLWRPGTIGMQAVGGRTHNMFSDGSLGVMGTFSTYSPPTIEILTAGTPGSTVCEGSLRAVRIE